MPKNRQANTDMSWKERCVDTRTKVITFYGLEDDVDIYLYLSSVFSKLGKKVLFIDNSIQKFFSDCIPGLTEDVEGMIVEYKYISYCRNHGYDKGIFSEYDVVINLSGLYYDKDMEERSDIRFVLTDFQKIHLRSLLNVMQHIEREFVMIYRDSIGGYIDSSYVDIVLGEKRRNIKERCIVELTENDRINSLQMQYSNTFRFDKLTDSCKNIIMYIVKSTCKEFEWRKPALFG